MWLAWLALTAWGADPLTGGDTPAMNTQLYRFPLDAARTMWADDSAIAEPGTIQGRVGLGYMRAPLGYWLDGEGPVNLVDHFAHMNLMGSYTFRRVRVGVDLPITLIATSDVSDNVTGLGDAALDLKVSFLDRAIDGIGVSFGGRVLLPTGSTGTNPALGSSGFGGELQAIIDDELGPVLVALNVGARVQPKVALENTTLNDQVFYRLGGGYAVSEVAGVSLDLAGHFNFSATDVAAVPLEVMLGGYGPVSDQLVLRGGVSSGLTKAVGSPLYRGVLLVDWKPPQVKDGDGDGIDDRDDACPMDPEDVDGFEDADGCPDLDNDADGILDTADACPLVPEDMDGHRDEDGCVDAETPVTIRITDPSGIPASVVAILSGETYGDEIGNLAKLELNPGAYTVMGEAPGFKSLDATFEVPEQTEPYEVTLTMEPVIKIGSISIFVVNTDGQPVASTWQFPGQDQAPHEISTSGARIAQPPGEYTIIVRADDYGAANITVDVKADKDTPVMVTLKPSKVKVSLERIDISDKVFFDTGKATIQAESFGLLDEVAIVLIDHPELFLVSVEGHTDSRGSASANLRLSKARAASVRDYLIKRGVAAERLKSEGYGEERPLNPAENAEAWDMNRRVEFFVVERDDDRDGKPDPAHPADEPAPTVP